MKSNKILMFEPPIQATVSQIAASDQVGGFIGTIEGVESFSGIIGPTIGGLVVGRGTNHAANPTELYQPSPTSTNVDQR